MKLRLFTPLVLAAALLAPDLAYGLGTIEGFYGIARPTNRSFKAATSSASDDPHLFKNSLQIAGGDVLINFGTFQVGAIADVNWAEDSASQSAIGALLGAKIPIGPMRLDLMGEAGGHRYGNLGANPRIARSGSDEWLAYLGVRPGIAFKFAAPDRPGFLLGVWTYARWDLTTRNVPVSVRGAVDEPGNVKIGGVSIGATLRAGFEF